MFVYIGSFQFTTTAFRLAHRMVACTTRYQRGALSYALTRFAALQAGHRQKGARGPQNEVDKSTIESVFTFTGNYRSKNSYSRQGGSGAKYNRVNKMKKNPKLIQVVKPQTRVSLGKQM